MVNAPRAGKCQIIRQLSSTPGQAKRRPGSLTQVSVEGFEPSTPCARGTCATKLRHTLNWPYHFSGRVPQESFVAPGGTRTQHSPDESRSSLPVSTTALQAPP